MASSDQKNKMTLKINKNARLAANLFAKPKLIPTRDGYGEGLVIAGKRDKNVVALCGDLTESTRTQAFAEKFPERFIECGVAEQNMIGVAAGMALSGKVPFVSTYAVFCPGRNWDQLRVSVCYSKANVKLTGAHSGISVGPDGATHQALEDIAITRCLPNLTVIAPCDYIETRKATLEAARHKGPVYLRFGRNETPVITTEKTPFKIGKAETFIEGSDATIIGCGPVVYEAMLAAKKLEKELSVGVINLHTIKPIDKKAIITAAKRTGALVTIEEHQVNGGMGSAVAEVVAQYYPVPTKIIGMPDSFGESGQPDELLKKYGMKANNIIKALREVVKLKK